MKEKKDLSCGVCRPQIHLLGAARRAVEKHATARVPIDLASDLTGGVLTPAVHDDDFVRAMPVK
jgi:hypothetical protein